MLFNSLEFLIFLPVVVALFYALPHRVRWLLLLVASYVFYCFWSIPYGGLLLLVSALDWWAAVRVEDASTPTTRLRWLYVSLAGNLGLLFAFKYYNLLNDTFAWLVGFSGAVWPLPHSEWILPIGISFHTFQSMSYTIDVYRGNIKAERKPGMYLLFVAYFPQLVAGPVERAPRLLPQLSRPVSFDWDRAASGLRLIAWGMFKKVVVADRLAEVVDIVYTTPRDFGAPAHLLATVFFAYQVYCDFSGYSDIATGCARILGVDLMRNFEQPYLSRSFTELWTRWHISMTAWFRDYVYLPLGGSRVSPGRWAFNVFVIFVLSGLWHGARWNLLSWGACNALFVVLERFSEPVRARLVAVTRLDRLPVLRGTVAWGTTFGLWLVSLVFFRSNTLTDAVYIFTHAPFGWWIFGDVISVGLVLIRVHLDGALALYCLLLMPFVELVDQGWRNPAWAARWARLPTLIRWGFDWALVFATLVLGSFGEVPFIYFQF